MQGLGNLGDTSFSDVLNNLVSQLPNIVTGVATYDLTSKAIASKSTATVAPAGAVTYSPSLPYSYAPNYSPVYPAQPTVTGTVTASNNTLLYLAIGGAALLLIMGLRS